MQFIKKNHFFFEIAFIILLSLIPLIWFSPQHMIFGSDSGYPLDYVQYFIQRTFTWTSSQSFGEDNSTFMGALPLHGIQYVLSVIGIPYFDIQKVTFVFWFASVAFSMYFCVRYFFRRPEEWAARIIPVVLYSINFYIFLFWTIGSQTTLSAYAFLPITFLLLFKFINKDLSAFNTAAYLNLFFLIFNGGGVAGLPLLGPVIVVGLGLIVYQLFIQFRKKYIVEIAKLIFYSLVLFICLNAYYLLPFVLSFTQNFNTLVIKNGGVEGVIEWTQFISKFDSYINLFRLQGDNIWYVNNDLYPSLFLRNPLLIIASFVFVVTGYSALLFKANRNIKKLIYFLVPLSLAGVFLAAGAHEPLGSLYILMIKYIPGFAAFRSAFYKFMPLVLFSFAILNGITIYYVAQKFKNAFISLLPFIFILFLLFYHFPFYDVGNFLTNYKFKTMITIPDYVQNFSKEKPPQNDKYRTLVLPPFNQNLGVEIYDWDYYSGYPIFPGVSGKSYVENNAYLTANEKLLVNRLYPLLRDKRLDSFLGEASRLSIKYILLTSDVYTENVEGPREQPKIYEAILKDSRFKPTWKSGRWALYEINFSINPKIYAFNELHEFKGSIEELPPYLQSSNFIQTSELDPPANIPFNSRIVGLTCTSCSSDVHISLEANPSRILPNSLFYPLKKYQESKLTSTAIANADIYLLLGLTLKRISELKGLAGFATVSNSSSWLKSVDSLESNWMEIEKLLEADKEDIAAMKSVQKYTEFEIGSLRDVYFYEATSNNTDIKKKLEDVINIITRVQSSNDIRVYQIESKHRFVYKLENYIPKNGEVIISTNSLARNENGQVLYPKRVQYDSKEPFIFVVQNEASEITLPKSNDVFARITLQFPEPANLLSKLQIRKISPSYLRNEVCLVGEIGNFRWDKTYRVSARISSNRDNLRVYVVRNKINGGYQEFRPEKTIEIDKQNKDLVLFTISGKENDRSIEVFFCSDPGRNPLSAFSAIRANESYRPVVYYKEDINLTETKLPKITFKKINPTEYEIKVDNANDKFFLTFTDRYSSQWKLASRDGKVGFDNNHFMMNGYSNGWIVDRKGSYDLILKFSQQEIFKTGIVISAISLIGLGVILAYSFISREKGHEEKH